MKKELKLHLIDGIFDAVDATDVILSMIDKKIEFNELSSFRNFVKFNKKDVQLQKRIDNLKQARAQFMEFAKQYENTEFKIQSEILLTAL